MHILDKGLKRSRTDITRDYCVFIGGYNTGPFWIINDCFDQYNKFDCACKKKALE